MKPVSILVLVALWGASVAGAYLLGGKYSSSSSRVATVSSGDSGSGGNGTGPGKPKLPGTSTRALAEEAATQGAAARPSLKQILAQIKLLMRSGGMNNPGTALKALTLLGQIADEDIPKALEAAADAKEPQAKMMLYMVLLSRMAEKDGPAALKYAEEHLKNDGPMGGGLAKMAILSSWAQSDPEAAWKWIQSQKDEEDTGGVFGGRGMMMNGVFSAMAAKDPEKAFARLAELEDKQQRTMALVGIAQTAFDDESRARLFTEIAKLPDADERKEARSAILGQMAMMEPDKAMEMAKALPADERKDVASRVGGALMMSDPKKGADFLVQNADEGNRSSAYAQAVSMWAGRDANAAGAWLGEQPQGPELDAARSSFATTVAAKDPESAMEWAKTVSDENQRGSAVGSVYQQWVKKDAGAANAALESSGLPADRIQGIKSMKIDATTPRAFAQPVGF